MHHARAKAVAVAALVGAAVVMLPGVSGNARRLPRVAMRPRGKAKAALCAACHGPVGVSRRESGLA